MVSRNVLRFCFIHCEPVKRTAFVLRLCGNCLGSCGKGPVGCFISVAAVKDAEDGEHLINYS